MLMLMLMLVSATVAKTILEFLLMLVYCMQQWQKKSSSCFVDVGVRVDVVSATVSKTILEFLLMLMLMFVYATMAKNT